MPTHQFTYEAYETEKELTEADAELLQLARNKTASAYAPYSKFNVAAAARLTNGTVVYGTNQENASYPVGICAERTLLSVLASVHPSETIDTIAITYNNLNGDSSAPASPCGLCRQSLLEYEERLQHPIRLLLAGQSGKIIGISKAIDLLPFSFTAENMQ